MAPQNYCREVILKMRKSGFRFPRGFSVEIDDDAEFFPNLCKLVGHGFDVNSTNTEGESILLWLVKHFPDESLAGIVPWLFFNGAKPHKKHPKSKQNALELLLSNLDPWREENMPSLFTTATILVQKGLTMRKWKPAPDRTGQGSSHYSNVVLEVLRFILDSGIDVNCSNESGINLLMLLASNYFQWDDLHDGKIELARMLFERGIDVNKTADHLIFDSLNALNFLCVRANGTIDKDFCELVELFVSKGVDINNIYHYGNAQQTARRNSLIELCLVAKPLDEAEAEAIASLIKHGIDVHYADRHNAVTALCSREGVPHLKGVLHLARILVNDCKVAVSLPHKNALKNLVEIYFGPTKEIQNNGQTKVVFEQIAPGKHVLKKTEDNERDFYSLIELLLSNTNKSGSENKRHLGEALIQICLNYWGKNILDVVKLLCAYGADVNTRIFARDSGRKVRECNAVEIVTKNQAQKHRVGQIYCILNCYGFHQSIPKDYREQVVEHLSSAECANVCSALGRKQQLGDCKNRGRNVESHSLASLFSQLNL